VVIVGYAAPVITAWDGQAMRTGSQGLQLGSTLKTAIAENRAGRHCLHSVEMYAYGLCPDASAAT
jgi:hypothetical protein